MNFFLLKEYIQYFHLKTDEHSLHSPFFYKFYERLIKKRTYFDEWTSIETQRKRLLNRNTKYEIFDLGAGSRVEKSKDRTVKSIAKHSLSSPKFSQFLFRLIREYKLVNIVELGTSLGINTKYLAKSKNNAVINTFEADQNALKIAKEVNLNELNITFHTGDIAETLPNFLQKHDQNIDLVYADANHTFKASIQYYNLLLPKLHSSSIYILDDIHWSSEMKMAWKTLKAQEEVTSSIDLFDAGLLFFDPDLRKQHLVLDFSF